MPTERHGKTRKESQVSDYVFIDQGDGTFWRHGDPVECEDFQEGGSLRHLGSQSRIPAKRIDKASHLDAIRGKGS